MDQSEAHQNATEQTQDNQNLPPATFSPKTTEVAPVPIPEPIKEILRKRRIFPNGKFNPGATPRKDRVFKERFVKKIIENGGNKTKAYRELNPHITYETAGSSASRLFKDPYVQEIYQASGVDVHYLARRSKQLMESRNETVASNMVKMFVKPLLDENNVQRVERVSVTLFGELTDGEVRLVKKGKLLNHGRNKEETREEDGSA